MKQEELDELEVGEKVLYKERNVVGEIIETEGIIKRRLNFSSDDISAEEIPGVIKPENLQKMPLCDEGHESAVFNDKKGKWVCPFCQGESG